MRNKGSPEETKSPIRGISSIVQPAFSAAATSSRLPNASRAPELPTCSMIRGCAAVSAMPSAAGGGLATTFLRPIEGGEQIARAWIEIANRAPSNMTFLERTVNGQPGLVAQQDGVTVTVFAFDVAGGRITHIWAVRNPEKLRPWTPG